MKNIIVTITVESFCPDGCLEISPIKTRDNRLICLNSDRCKNLWKHLTEKPESRRATARVAPTEGTEAEA